MKMMTTFGEYDVKLTVQKYQADGSVALDAWNEEEGPIARLTVCLDSKDLGENESFIDTNNCPWAIEFLEKNGLGKLTGRQKRSGFCIYPAMKLDVKKISEVA